MWEEKESDPKIGPQDKKKLALKDRRTTRKRISNSLAEEGISISRRTINRRPLESDVKAYRPRKKHVSQHR